MNPNLSYQEILDLIDTFDVVAYARTRNHLNGTVSRLSPYITRSVIDLPTIRDRLLKRYSYAQAEKFIQELAWREYFQKVWFAKQDEIFSDMRFARDDWAHEDLVKAISDATTGIETIDHALHSLFETGYMHNHARMWTAMLACNVGKVHWYNMGRFLYYHLLDGDLGSNFLSWQWVAGTNSSKQYVANQSLISGCSSIKQTNSYLNIPIEDIGYEAVPFVLMTRQPFDYKTDYPASDTIIDLSGKTVFLYHPWSIDPLWRGEEEGERIMVIEPHVFDRFPVSPKVMTFILNLTQTHIKNCQIFIGDVDTLPGLSSATAIYSKGYPATAHWPGVIEAPAELFPTAKGYFSSFFKFWQACLKAR